MAGKFHHETLYRGPAALAKLASVRITLCGAGAIGSHLADHLARQGVASLRVIDRDRVEEHNVSTQLYGETDVGVWKVEALRNRLFRAAGVEVDAARKDLGASNAAALLKGADVIIDAFDNAAARRAVQDAARASGAACLHVGLYEGYGEVVWDPAYRVPRDPANGNACDYPLARNLVALTCAIASESLVAMICEGRAASWSVTLADLAIRPFGDDDDAAARSAPPSSVGGGEG